MHYLRDELPAAPLEPPPPPPPELIEPPPPELNEPPELPELIEPPELLTLRDGLLTLRDELLAEPERDTLLLLVLAGAALRVELLLTLREELLLTLREELLLFTLPAEPSRPELRVALELPLLTLRVELLLLTLRPLLTLRLELPLLTLLLELLLLTLRVELLLLTLRVGLVLLGRSYVLPDCADLDDPLLTEREALERLEVAGATLLTDEDEELPDCVPSRLTVRFALELPVLTVREELEPETLRPALEPDTLRPDAVPTLRPFPEAAASFTDLDSARFTVRRLTVRSALEPE